MNRRSFLRSAALTAAALAIDPVRAFSAPGEPARASVAPEGLQLKFYPYELKLRHSFNLARSQRTTTPDVLCTITLDLSLIHI